MNPITMQLVADEYIRMALKEDINSEDVSTNAVMSEYRKGEVQLLAKADGIIAGLQVFERVFKLLDEATETKFEVKDGDTVTKGQFLGVITGDIRVLLSGERTALNYLQRMSGIATYTNQVAKLLEGTKTTLLDTRKTTPCMRIFEKYAVKVGGGSNHRYNLSDLRRRLRRRRNMPHLSARSRWRRKISIWCARQWKRALILSCWII